MRKYRELAKGRSFRCSQCGRRKFIKYVPTSDLCRECASRRRKTTSNVPVLLTDELVVTKIVEKKLKKRAVSEVPASKALKIGENGQRFSFLAMWVSAPFVTRALFHEFSEAMWIFVFVWAMLIPYALLLATDRLLTKPRRERQELISARIVQLARERQQRIEEYERFYSSPEWIVMRAQVINEDGRGCAECGREIMTDSEVTVDHKRPRSKFPELSLKRENLRVLCRRCNSRKGAKEWVEL